MNGVTLAWLTEIALIGVRDMQGKGAAATPPGVQVGTPGGRLPWPSELLATFVLYGLLSLAPEGQWHTAAAAIGWGFVAATFLGIYDPTRKFTNVKPSLSSAAAPAGQAPGRKTQ